MLRTGSYCNVPNRLLVQNKHVYLLSRRELFKILLGKKGKYSWDFLQLISNLLFIWNYENREIEKKNLLLSLPLTRSVALPSEIISPRLKVKMMLHWMIKNIVKTKQVNQFTSCCYDSVSFFGNGWIVINYEEVRQSLDCIQVIQNTY